MGDFAEFTAQYAEVLHKALGMPVLITDRDRVVALAGVPKKDYTEKRVSKALETVMEERAGYIAGRENAAPLCPVEDDDRRAALAFPVVGNGDVSGCVCALLNADNALPATAEIKLVQVAAQFLAKQTED